MAVYLILGAGKFGQLALARLGRQDAGAHFVVVDQSPAALAEASAVCPIRMQAVAVEAIEYLTTQLGPDAPWDWLIPVVPVHVAFAWLSRGPLAGTDWGTAAVPASLEDLAPLARRGPGGELYLSRATHLCPDDCPEPEGFCPVRGEVRDIPLHEALAAWTAPGWRMLVVASRQLAPGVGGYPPARLSALARDLAARPGKVLVATACRCHGVVHGLARTSRSDRGV